MGRGLALLGLAVAIVATLAAPAELSGVVVTHSLGDQPVVPNERRFTVDLPAQEPEEGVGTGVSTPSGDTVSGALGPIDGTVEPSSSLGGTPRGEGPERVRGGPWIRWMQLVGTVLLLGAAGVRFAVLPTTGMRVADPEARARIVRGLSRFGWLAALLLLVSLPLRLADRVGALGNGAGLGEALVLLFETVWGAGWLLHLGAVTLAVLGLVLASPGGRRGRGWVVFALAALVIPLVSALQGHAWSQEEARGLAVLSLYLHVLGAGLWLGGLVLLLLVGLPALRSSGRPGDAEAEEESDEDKEVGPSFKPALARLVNAFSRVALPAAVLVLASGVVNAWLEVGEIEALLGSDYGRTLLVKVAFVAGAMALGYYNWRRVRPTLVERPDAGSLGIPASVEALLGLVILFVTAVLAATPTP